MTRKEYIDAIAVYIAIRDAVLEMWMSEHDNHRVELFYAYYLELIEKIRGVLDEWEQEINLPKLMEIFRISGLSSSEFSKKYGVSKEALIGEEVLDESTIASLEKKVYEDKAKANLTWAVFDDNGNVENIITASSREEALKIAEDIWHHLTDYERKHKIRFDVALAHLDEDDEHFGDSWIIAKDFLEEN